MIRFSGREWDLVRLAVLGRRVPLDDAALATYRGLVARVGLVTDEEWETLLAKLQTAAAEDLP